MADCNSCPSKDNCTSQDTCNIKNNPFNNIKNVIGIMSGKGGVGKSTVSTMIAKDLNKKGFKVGIMDADITGPSIPRLLGLSDKKALGSPDGMIPVESQDGIKAMSLNFLVEEEADPVIWRGPMVGGVVEQFWNEVLWGELDYLIIDMPPGTGDVALTVMQSIPLSGIVMVSVPHDMVSMIVTKAINMTNKMNIPVLGLVENMAYVLCPKCGEKIEIFDSENIIEFLNETNLELLGEFPMTKGIVNLAKNEELGNEIDKELDKITKRIIEKL